MCADWVGPDEQVRLACLGYVLSTKSHSFHEVMAVGEYFGGEYEAGNYQLLAPLSPEKITWHCGFIKSECQSKFWHSCQRG